MTCSGRLVRLGLTDARQFVTLFERELCGGLRRVDLVLVLDFLLSLYVLVPYVLSVLRVVGVRRLLVGLVRKVRLLSVRRVELVECVLL